METVVHNISSWVAPYYVCRLLDGFDFNYDCTDAPTGSLMGAATMSVKTDVDFSIVEFAIGIGLICKWNCLILIAKNNSNCKLNQFLWNKKQIPNSRWNYVVQRIL